MRVLRRARVFKFGLNVPAVSAETALTAITRNGKTLISGVQYDALGRPTTWRWADGQIARRRYDSGTGLMIANNAAAYGYDWYAGRITGITQNLYMPKTDAAEDELGFALQSNFYQIGYDQRGRIKTFNRSAQATVGLPAIYETQAYAWDKNGNPSFVRAFLRHNKGVNKKMHLK